MKKNKETLVIKKKQTGLAADPHSEKPGKRPYVRPVLTVIGKVGKIFSNN